MCTANHILRIIYLPNVGHAQLKIISIPEIVTRLKRAEFFLAGKKM
jgi:hypothetical protein